jgi:hypothetical protein
MRKSVSVPLSVKLPPKRVREKFLIIYELEGGPKAVNCLTEYNIPIEGFGTKVVVASFFFGLLTDCLVKGNILCAI